MNFVCKFCKKKVVECYSCDICKSTFHRSCGLQAKVINKENKVVCCVVSELRSAEEEDNSSTMTKVTLEEIQVILKRELMALESRVIKRYEDRMRELQESINFMSDKFEEQKKSYEDALERNKELTEINKNLLSRVEILEFKINESEQKEKSKNIVVSGIPVQETKSTKEVVEQLLAGLSLNVGESEVVDCYRMKSRGINDPILIKCATDEMKEKIMTKRKHIGSIKTKDCKFEGPNNTIYLNHELTKLNQTLFAKMRALRKQGKFKYAYFTHGKLYLKKQDGDRPIRVYSESSLNSIDQ